MNQYIVIWNKPLVIPIVRSVLVPFKGGFTDLLWPEDNLLQVASYLCCSVGIPSRYLLDDPLIETR